MKSGRHMHSGAFIVKRHLFESRIWKDAVALRLYIWLLGHAVFSETGVMVAGFLVKRGQFLRSFSKLLDDLAIKRNNRIIKYSKSTLSRAIAMLEKDSWITKRTIRVDREGQETEELGTLFTITNYDELQSMIPFDSDSGQCFQGLNEACSELGTGLGTPSTSNTTNNRASEIGSSNEHGTGNVASIERALDKNRECNNENEINKIKGGGKYFNKLSAGTFERKNKTDDFFSNL